MNNQQNKLNAKENQMMLFCLLSYYGFAYKDKKDVQEKVDYIVWIYNRYLDYAKISWGPVAAKPIINNSEAEELVTCALMYVAKHDTDEKATPEYTLAIRGTNPISLYAWLCLDLDVKQQELWSDALNKFGPKPEKAIDVGEDIKISRATYSALGIHVGLKDDEGRTVLDWISNTIEKGNPKKIKLNITGHSMGGVLSTTLGLWLHERLAEKGLLQYVDLSIYSFAAPTAGNNAFVTHTEKRLRGKYKCYINELDMVTHAWAEENVRKLPKIYQQKGDIQIEPIRAELKTLASLLEQCKDKKYQRLDSQQSIYSDVRYVSIVVRTTYLAEAIYQHIAPYLYDFDDALRFWLGVGIVLDILRYLARSSACTDSAGNTLELIVSQEEMDDLCNFVKDEVEKQKEIDL